MTAAPVRETSEPAQGPVSRSTPENTPVQRRRRFTELVLLIIAWVIGIGANILVDPELAMEQPGHVYRTAAVLVIGGLILHGVLWLRARYADPYILPIVVALNGLGIAMIHRIDLLMNSTAGTNQVLWTGFGMVAATLVLVFLRDHRRLRQFTYISLLASAVLLILPLLPGLGTEINGARIWISIGGRTFQPGEIAKITLAVFFAGYLSTNRDVILLAGPKLGPVRLPRFRDLAPMFAAWLVSIGVLVFQRDLGTAILFFGLFVAMLYLATGRLSWIVLGLLFVAAGGLVASQTFGHVAARLDSWWNAFNPAVYDAPVGGSRQIVQGIFGLASGGLFGQGLGQGRPDLVSFANSDMIIAAFGEELGLIGLAAILLLFFLLISRGFRAALGTPDAFGKLLAGGLAAAMVIQLFVVIGGVTRVIPLTGLTTPFMSAGGSSLLSNWIIASLLLAISHSARRPVVSGPASEEDIAEFEAHEREEQERAEMEESERAERAERRRARQEAARREREERKARERSDDEATSAQRDSAPDGPAQRTTTQTSSEASAETQPVSRHEPVASETTREKGEQA